MRPPRRTIASDAKEARRRLRENPKDPDALFAQAAVFAVTGRTREAIVGLERVGQLAPHYPGLWRLLAQLHRSLGNAQRQRICLLRAEQEEALDDAATVAVGPG